LGQNWRLLFPSLGTTETSFAIVVNLNEIKAGNKEKKNPLPQVLLTTGESSFYYVREEKNIYIT